MNSRKRRNVRESKNENLDRSIFLQKYLQDIKKYRLTPKSDRPDEYIQEGKKIFIADSTSNDDDPFSLSTSEFINLQESPDTTSLESASVTALNQNKSGNADVHHSNDSIINEPINIQKQEPDYLLVHHSNDSIINEPINNQKEESGYFSPETTNETTTNSNSNISLKFITKLLFTTYKFYLENVSIMPLNAMSEKAFQKYVEDILKAMKNHSKSDNILNESLEDIMQKILNQSLKSTEFENMDQEKKRFKRIKRLLSDSTSEENSPVYKKNKMK